MKIKFFVLFAFAFMLFPLVNADVISLNSGGSEVIVINPDTYIEGFFGCVPTTCAKLSYTCDSWTDGCGKILNCGSCGSGFTCTAGNCVAVPVTPPSGGGGGGGGAAECSLVTTPSSINLDLKAETNKIQIINVKNIGTTTINLIPKQIQNLDKYSIIFDPGSLSLGPGETKELILRIVAFNETGIFTDTIQIGCSNLFGGINIKTVLLLFDSNIVVLNQDYKVSKGNDLRTRVTLIPMGDEERLDVTLNYVIKNYDGKVYLTQSETVLVEKKINFRKNFGTGSLPLGKYIVGLELVYPGGVAPSSAHFEVVEKTGSDFLGALILILIFLILVIAIVIVILIIRRKRKEEQSQSG